MERSGRTSRRHFWCILLAALLVVTGVPVPGNGGGEGIGVTTAAAATDLPVGTEITIKFQNVYGTEIASYRQTAKIGDTITFPSAGSGRRWRLDSEFNYRSKSKLTLDPSADWADFLDGTTLTFRAEKFYYVNFYNSNGSSTGKMKALQMTPTRGTRITLPEVPAVSGYKSLGWAVKKNATTAKYKAGQKIKVRKNLKLYAVRVKISTSRVTFNNNTGTSKSSAYKALGKKVETGSTITLPELPAVIGYSAVGWTTTKGGATPLYEAGSTVTITGATVFYSVYEKTTTYTVSFYAYNGKSNANYRKLKSVVNANEYLTLPSVPERSGYVSLGWSTSKNATSASKNVLKAGEKLKVTKNTKLYAVQEAGVSITLCKNDGTVYRTVSVGKGNYFTLPAIANGSGTTFLGWSRTQGQTTNPEYEAGGTIRVNSAIKLYAVVFDRSQEPDLSAANMTQMDFWKEKYKQVIFVGDSRTVGMENTLDYQFGTSSTVTWNVKFVCSAGKGLTWLQNEGYTELMNIINRNNSVQKPTAVIFNLGINDLSNLPSYVTYMDSIADTLKNKNCQLFYMSVNPGNSKTMENIGRAVRNEASVRRLNKTIQQKLSEDYTYIDTYSWLMYTGYSTNSSYSGRDSSTDDGLHYTTKTYKRIYYHCLEFLMNQ